jgi:hypothetical protein
MDGGGASFDLSVGYHNSLSGIISAASHVSYALVESEEASNQAASNYAFTRLGVTEKHIQINAVDPENNAGSVKVYLAPKANATSAVKFKAYRASFSCLHRAIS